MPQPQHDTRLLEYGERRRRRRRRRGRKWMKRMP
jgi:hypothetical protein